MLKQIIGWVQREDFIAAMRRVASSVTVVTTDGTAGRFGATVSAFSSVSADPPTVLVCLFAQSRIARAISENGRFCVNVLPEESARIADRFAGRDDASVLDRFNGIPLNIGYDTPQIAGATVFDCVVDQSIVSSSHLIFTGNVRAVSDAGAAPLAYRDGGYHRVIPHGVGAQNRQDRATR
jgi:flavin reductase (DIM6/NTAB) family NADH-FMN oxidoreductase RutF